MRYNTLMEAQMGEYPDSVVLTDSQMLDALRTAIPDWLVGYEFKDWDQKDWFDESYFDQWRKLQTQEDRAQWARSAFLYRTTHPDGFFYACGKREDGTYRNVGFRFGLEDQEYASGFAGMTYTPKKGESK